MQRWVRTRQIPAIRIGDVIRIDGAMLADRIELEEIANRPNAARFLHPRSPGNPDEYQMKREDLGELAPEEFRMPKDKAK